MRTFSLVLAQIKAAFKGLDSFRFVGVVLHFYSKTSTRDCPGALPWQHRGRNRGGDQREGKGLLLDVCVFVHAPLCFWSHGFIMNLPAAWNHVIPRSSRRHTCIQVAQVRVLWILHDCTCAEKDAAQNDSAAAGGNFWGSHSALLGRASAGCQGNWSMKPFHLVDRLSLACASKSLPLSPGYDRAAVLDSPIEPPS